MKAVYNSAGNLDGGRTQARIAVAAKQIQAHFSPAQTLVAAAQAEARRTMPATPAGRIEARHSSAVPAAQHSAEIVSRRVLFCISSSGSDLRPSSRSSSQRT